MQEKKHLAQHGRGVALWFGQQLKGKWFGPRNWPQWEQRLPKHLLNLLQPLRQVIAQLHIQIEVLTQELEASVALRTGQATPQKLGLELAQP